MTLTVAVLGTGKMGAPMAANVAAAGHAVRVYDRARAKAERLAERADVVVADDPAAAAGADVPQAEMNRRVVHAAAEAGYGQDDLAAVARPLRGAAPS